MQLLMRQHDYLEAKTTKFKSCFWESTIRKEIFLFFRDWTIISPMLIHVWDCKFRLLGIDFTADLTNMEKNYYDKIKEVRKLLNS